jgi:hypothetical protein
MAEKFISLEIRNLNYEEFNALSDFLRSQGTLEWPYRNGPTSADIKKEAGESDFNSDVPDEEDAPDESEDEPAELPEPPKKKAKAKAPDPVEEGTAIIKAFKTYFEKNGSAKAKAVLKTLKISKISEVKPDQYAKALKLLK